MRRAHSGGYGYEPVPSTSRDHLEGENDHLEEELRDKIHALKSLSIDIGQEVKFQDKMLRGMDDDFEKTSGLLGNTAARVVKMAKAGHNYYIFYIFIFSIVVFFVLWIVLKFQ